MNKIKIVHTTHTSNYLIHTHTAAQHYGMWRSFDAYYYYYYYFHEGRTRRRKISMQKSHH